MFSTSKSNQFFTFGKRMKWVRAQRSLVIRFWRAVSSETAQIGESWLLKWVMRVGCVSRGKALGAGDRWRESWLTGDFHKWSHNLIMSPRERSLLRLDLNVRVSLFSPVTLSPDLGIRRQFYTFREKRAQGSLVREFMCACVLVLVRRTRLFYGCMCVCVCAWVREMCGVSKYSQTQRMMFIILWDKERRKLWWLQTLYTRILRNLWWVSNWIILIFIGGGDAYYLIRIDAFVF